MKTFKECLDQACEEHKNSKEWKEHGTADMFDAYDRAAEIFQSQFTTPTVTDEEIERRAEKFADDWEELGYSRENAYDYFKSGAKWMQSRLSQPVNECDCDSEHVCGICHKSKGYTVVDGKLVKSQPVTGYSEENLPDKKTVMQAARDIFWEGERVKDHQNEFFNGFMTCYEYFKSLKSKSNNGSNEGATRYGDAVEFHRWMKENEDTQENINLSEWELYTKFKEGRI